MSDNVNHPSHYLKAAVTIEPIELTSRLSSCYGQALQYILRAPYKGNTIEDLNKALFYLQKADEIFDYPKIYSNNVTYAYLTVFRLHHQNGLFVCLLRALFVDSKPYDFCGKRRKCSYFEVTEESLARAIDILSHQIRELESTLEECRE